MDYPVDIDYNQELDPLVEILEGVDRPGDYFAAGSLVAPMPGLTVSGVGRIAFPLLPAQASAISDVAEQAPYGQGEETVVDRKVRDVRQLAPAEFRLSGTMWPDTLDRIVEEVANGLGCVDFEVKAELYKLLLYEEGGFFVPHRDTEKTKGMFGTLVIALPSEHRGGDLKIRHQGGEATVTLNAGDESELRFAAFYADCEHEVAPIENGTRLCLVYNLVRGRPRKEGRTEGAPQPPDYREEIDQASAMLSAWAKLEARSLKVAYLLDHEYTPEGLSFSGLKNQDAARAKVLAEAAGRAGLAIHLGIVHIAEYGAAEVYGGYGYGRRSQWDWDDEEEDKDYELIEAFDGEQSIDEWMDPSDRRVEFGAVPLADEELIPPGALDNEPPDDIRVSEATGNEGGSYERFYHRAALVFWPEDETADVLLQAGAPAVVPHFGKLANMPTKERDENAVTRLARKITDFWDARRPEIRLTDEEAAKDAAPRVAMLKHLTRFGDRELIGDFIRKVVASLYCGNENTALCDALNALNSGQAVELAASIVTENGERCFSELTDCLDKAETGDLPAKTVRSMVEGLVAVLEKWKPPPSPAGRRHYPEAGRFSSRRDARSFVERFDLSDNRWKSLDSGALVKLIETLHRLPRPGPLIRRTIAALTASARTFPPDDLLFPAVVRLQRDGMLNLSEADHFLTPLWTAAAEFHLKRSGKPPAEPRDWTLRGQKTSCSCEDCTRLMEFVRSPVERVARFPLAKERRKHLHRNIDANEMEMTHQTERKGRPYTLVLTKTRRRYEARLKEYAEDLKRLETLASLVKCASPEDKSTVSELNIRIGRVLGKAKP